MEEEKKRFILTFNACIHDINQNNNNTFTFSIDFVSFEKQIFEKNQRKSENRQTGEKETKIIKFSL